MTTFFFLCVITLVVAGLAWLRVRDGERWNDSLVGFRLRLPAGVTIGDIANWLNALAAATQAPDGLFVDQRAVVVEVVARRNTIEHRLLVPRSLVAAVHAGLRAGLPGARLDVLDGVDMDEPGDRVTAATSVMQVDRRHLLAVDRAEAASRGLLAALQPVGTKETIRWQWIIAGTETGSVNPGGQQRRPGADARSIERKQREPQFRASGRVLASTSSARRSRALLRRALAPLRLLKTPTTRLTPSWWPSSLVSRAAARRWQSLLPPLRLTGTELAAVLALPVGEGLLSGVAAPVARQLPPEKRAPKNGTIVADSNYSGSQAVPLGLSRMERTRHVWLTAPTGAGKSWLLANMALQDIERGDGLTVIDPKGDLTDDILARFPDRRRDDLVVFDPSDVSMPLGCNLLAHDGTTTDRERIVDDMVHVMRQQWSRYWGPRTDMILRLTLTALTYARAVDGSAFTLCEAPEFLTNKQFRHFVMNQSTIPEEVARRLRWFDGLGETQQAQIIGPVINKLFTLTTWEPLRLVLGQSRGLDLRNVVRRNMVLLVPLRRGLIGSEAAGLLGSILVAGLWQAALARAAVPSSQRRPYWYYIDEAQTVVRWPVADVSDLLGEARGLHIGVVGANQHLSQLPQEVRGAVLSTVRSHVVFQLEPDDAKVFARTFAPYLTAADLQSLPEYEVAMRLADGSHTGRPVTGLTRPLPAASADPRLVKLDVRQRYGVPRSEVEQALVDRLKVSKTTKGSARDHGQFGVRRAGPPDDPADTRGGDS